MDNRLPHQAILIPKQRGIQAQIQTVLLPIRQRRLNQRFIQSMDVDAGVTQPALPPPSSFPLMLKSPSGKRFKP